MPNVTAPTIIAQPDTLDGVKVTVRVRCPVCGNPVEVKDIPQDAFARWFNDGELIQLALPMLSPDDREALLTGFCASCFGKLSDDDEPAAAEEAF